MKAKLIVEGKEFDIDIFDPELQKLVKPEKKTGYENVGVGHVYYFTNGYDEIKNFDHENEDDDKHYNIANYYSDYEVAKNNARADKLMRQLRRFAVEHRVDGIDWNDCQNEKFFFWYNYDDKEIEIDRGFDSREVGAIYFDSRAAASHAIETFHDELIWYFTEYKDSL